ncbi:hypothetical protein SUGI_0319180 [Cryptomeria japonica]|nr:hypothetical protein SUGI_0319180 [Cryptomeria japonica]
MLFIDLVCDEEKNDTAEPAPENRRRKKKRKSKLIGHSSKKYGHLLSSQKHTAMEITAPFKSDKPFYKMVRYHACKTAKQQTLARSGSRKNQNCPAKEERTAPQKKRTSPQKKRELPSKEENRTALQKKNYYAA